MVLYIWQAGVVDWLCREWRICRSSTQVCFSYESVVDLDLSEDSAQMDLLGELLYYLPEPSKPRQVSSIQLFAQRR